jgi:hypothetical protein
MVRNSKQKWEIGQQVRVGFLTLVVKAAIPTPGDFRPDSYILSNLSGDKLYVFTPHHGIERIDEREALELMREFRERLERITAERIAQVAKQERARAAFAKVFSGVAA